ncbi:hypothetical protein DMH04_34190 [Kibdelosporangium aridum]|uniref:Thioesterase domain-containing protein n=1 Tax=Kibdelosporangium aridum TaxID=2030 RepID=A0A428Z0R0_KIBAR|nr:thioesterase domain-containing protein [Kibdelosporangium aridum]RSM78008.1 hypothetical protein DMH04_34190 [Kibdelosporangium aridum]
MIGESVDDGFANVLPLRQRGGSAPVFCIHPGIGVGWCYASMCAVVDRDRPLYVLQARALRPGGALGQSIGELALDYLGAIRQIRPTGPYHLLGWSLGGFVAHEIATLLRATGQEVGLLAIVDIFPGDGRRYGVGDGEHEQIEAFLRELGAPPTPGDAELSRATLWDHVCRIEGATDWWDSAQVDRMFDVFKNSCEISARFDPGYFDGDVLLFSAGAETARTFDVTEIWRPHVGGRIEQHSLPCEHRQMFDQKYAAHIAKIVSRRLVAEHSGG